MNPRHRLGAAIVGIVVFMLAWEGYVRVFDVRGFVLLAPSKILTQFADTPRFFVDNTIDTATHMFSGLAVALGLSIIVGTLLAASRFVEHAARPVLALLLVTPWIAYFASVRVWLGFGLGPVIFLAACASFPILTFGVIDGMRSTDPVARELLASVDARPWEVLWSLRLPAALPSVFGALRFAVGVSLAATYFAEGRTLRTTGLGAVGSRTELQPLTAAETMWTTVACTAALGVACLIALATFEGLVTRWYASRR